MLKNIPKPESISERKARNAVSWPGGAAISLYALISPILPKLCSLGQCIVHVHLCSKNARFINIFTFVIRLSLKGKQNTQGLHVHSTLLIIQCALWKEKSSSIHRDCMLFYRFLIIQCVIRWASNKLIEKGKYRVDFRDLLRECSRTIFMLLRP